MKTRSFVRLSVPFVYLSGEYSSFRFFDYRNF
jgi:hypothetical protein